MFFQIWISLGSERYWMDPSAFFFFFFFSGRTVNGVTKIKYKKNQTNDDQ